MTNKNINVGDLVEVINEFSSLKGKVGVVTQIIDGRYHVTLEGLGLCPFYLDEISKVDGTLSTLDSHIDNVMDEFDFPRVYRVMLHLNWQWIQAEGGIPTIGEMRRLVRKLMRDAYNECHKSGHNEYIVGTGGFEVGYNQEYDFFEVKFVVTDWRTDYRNE